MCIFKGKQTFFLFLKELTMNKKSTTKKFQVLYHQVDQMGIVHHAQYAYFLEQSRIEWLQNQGFSYAALERKGTLLPLADISIQFRSPLRFDDAFFVHVFLESFERFFVTFSYVLEDEEENILATAKTRLVFVDANTRKAKKCPFYLNNIFMPE